eukprot:CAMPEP_0202458690 /NCGR_PEP_ID=MMETSP1360-20130828/27075_1 /ASSEMBLY_ACC=CAM_ASM_000848 /TAXON_ID=515479 /ORGANISM="Licmophora paradoxa, Strain CCMP2313" /LENGTH=105 /DNA_ID=CAMNT_0049079351 /DNA_START=223 /DNA_END=540 /DNA_ORIENTATION=-
MSRVCDCVFCRRNHRSDEVGNVEDLNEILFGADETTRVRLATTASSGSEGNSSGGGGDNRDRDMTMDVSLDGFFCDVLNNKADNKREEEEKARDGGKGGFSEPLL